MWALKASRVTSTAATSIWLVIMAAMLGGPPISRMVSGSMFCSLKKPRSSATKYGSEELTGKTPTLTLSWAAAGPAPTAVAATTASITTPKRRLVSSPVVDIIHSPVQGLVASISRGIRHFTSKSSANSSCSGIDNGNDRPAAVRTLVHRVDRYEHRRVADRRCRDAADRGLRVPMGMNVRI